MSVCVDVGMYNTNGKGGWTTKMMIHETWMGMRAFGIDTELFISVRQLFSIIQQFIQYINIIEIHISDLTIVFEVS